MNKLKTVINNYINNISTLKTFEDNILLLMESQEDELLDDILEDIAYTTKEKLSKDLMSEETLKEKLREYLKRL